MSIDRKIMRTAQRTLEARRERRISDLSARRVEVYSKAPGLRSIDSELKLTALDIIRRIMSDDSRTDMENIKKESLELQARRAELLVSLGYPMDYIDDAPLCSKCGDTGYEGTAPCSCLMSIYLEIQTRELSSLLNIKDQNFDAFDLSYYDEVPDERMGISPRENMETILDICINYACHFGKIKKNYLFAGEPGLGKTYLSTCIANDVLKAGHSVVYDTAVNIFARFENEKFSRSDLDMAEQSCSRRYLECDLLIMDDLGTELITPFTQSALYTIVNTRLMTKKNTIINTNMNMNDMRRLYTPQIVSRLEGEYLTLPFFGVDIRIKRKEKELLL